VVAEKIFLPGWQTKVQRNQVQGIDIKLFAIYA